jgi:type IV pilus assembly protein PilZ
MPNDPAPAAAPPSDSEDLRIAARAPIRLRVDYERMNSFFADYTKNISKGGTFIKTARPLPLGTHFLFALSVPALSEPVQLNGEVTWVLTHETAVPNEQEPGMGIRFVFETEASREGFEKLVERLMEESLGPDVARGLLDR